MLLIDKRSVQTKACRPHRVRHQWTVLQARNTSAPDDIYERSKQAKALEKERNGKAHNRGWEPRARAVTI